MGRRSGFTPALPVSAVFAPPRAGGAGAIELVRSEYLLPDHPVSPPVDFYRRVFSELLVAAASLSVFGSRYDQCVLKR
jgi:hypothetical protein